LLGKRGRKKKKKIKGKEKKKGGKGFQSCIWFLLPSLTLSACCPGKKKGGEGRRGKEEKKGKGERRPRRQPAVGREPLPLLNAYRKNKG